MLSDFNKIFHPAFRRETPKQTEERILKMRTRAFYPGGITTRKKYFTPNELVDIYIKGNRILYEHLEDKGFGDEEFDRNRDEWQHALLSADKYVVPQELQERQKAFAMLVGEFLEIDRSLARLGHAAFSNRNIVGIYNLIPYFEKLAENYNLNLYYSFFAELEQLRQYNYDLAKVCEQGSFLVTYVEEKALCLERIQCAKENLKLLVLQIEGCNKIAKGLDERTDKNG
ncbi:MAG: hypothetical protein K2J77_13155 [Oscillospiraceae bacterium]|nr:hypothetical protein [Oscillospiraceae bacterium]